MENKKHRTCFCSRLLASELSLKSFAKKDPRSTTHFVDVPSSNHTKLSSLLEKRSLLHRREFLLLLLPLLSPALLEFSLPSLDPEPSDDEERSFRLERERRELCVWTARVKSALRKLPTSSNEFTHPPSFSHRIALPFILLLRPLILTPTLILLSARLRVIPSLFLDLIWVFRGVRVWSFLVLSPPPSYSDCVSREYEGWDGRFGRTGRKRPL